MEPSASNGHTINIEIRLAAVIEATAMEPKPVYGSLQYDAAYSGYRILKAHRKSHDHQISDHMKSQASNHFCLHAAEVHFFAM